MLCPLALEQFEHAHQAGLPAGNMQTYATLLDTFEFEETIGNSLVVKEPVGVVGAITPWNYPLHQIVGKVAPALVALNPSVDLPNQAIVLITREDDSGTSFALSNHLSAINDTIIINIKLNGPD